jgi:arylsulfatase A-like enzyme
MNKSILMIAALVMASVACAAQKPNIVYILCDDLGYGDIQCLNPERGKIKTPNVDRLAKEGMIFTDAHTGSSVCTPTRYGIMTGRYSWRSRLQSGVLSGISDPLIAPDRLTVPGLLRQNGYATGMVGKWHLGMTLPLKKGKASGNKDALTPESNDVYDAAKKIEDSPITRGFDTYFGISASLDMHPFAFIENDHFTQQPTAIKKWVRSGPAAPDFEAVDVLPTFTKKAVEYIEQQSKLDKPFFLYLPLASPHTPIVPSKEWQGKSGLGDYGDFVMQTDWTLGEIMKATEKAGIAKNTLIIFTSDNGCSPAAGIDKLQEQGHFPNGDFRGHKADIWDGGHRVPFIARWPDVIKAGSTTKQITCLTDLMATCAEITGAKLPDNAGEDSFSFLPLLKGEEKPIRETVIHHSIGGLFALRSLEWKLEICAGSGGWSSPKDAEALKAGLPPIQLYNMISDYKETKNVVAENKAIVDSMTQQLETLVTNGRSTPGAKQTNDVPVNIRKEAKAAKKGKK